MKQEISNKGQKRKTHKSVEIKHRTLKNQWLNEEIKRNFKKSSDKFKWINNIPIWDAAQTFLIAKFLVINAHVKTQSPHEPPNFIPQGTAKKGRNKAPN